MCKRESLTQNTFIVCLATHRNCVHILVKPIIEMTCRVYLIYVNFYVLRLIVEMSSHKFHAASWKGVWTLRTNPLCRNQVTARHRHSTDHVIPEGRTTACESPVFMVIGVRNKCKHWKMSVCLDDFGVVHNFEMLFWHGCDNQLHLWLDWLRIWVLLLHGWIQWKLHQMVHNFLKVIFGSKFLPNIVQLTGFFDCLRWISSVRHITGIALETILLTSAISGSHVRRYSLYFDGFQNFKKYVRGRTVLPGAQWAVLVSRCSSRLPPWNGSENLPISHR